MSASVRIAFILTDPILAATIVHRQTIHIGTNTDRVSRAITLNNSNNCSLDKIGIDIRDAPLTKVITNDTNCALGIKPYSG